MYKEYHAFTDVVKLSVINVISNVRHFRFQQVTNWQLLRKFYIHFNYPGNELSINFESLYNFFLVWGKPAFSRIIYILSRSSTKVINFMIVIKQRLGERVGFYDIKKIFMNLSISKHSNADLCILITGRPV